MKILDDQFFGTPLALAYWIQNKSNGHPMSDKILDIISNAHQKHCINFQPSSKLDFTAHCYKIKLGPLSTFF
jgi:hypothetical protein